MEFQKYLSELSHAGADGVSIEHTLFTQVQVLSVSVVSLQLAYWQPVVRTYFSTTHLGLPFNPPLKTIFTPLAASEESSCNTTLSVTVTGLLNVMTEDKVSSCELVWLVDLSTEVVNAPPETEALSQKRILTVSYVGLVFGTMMVELLPYPSTSVQFVAK